MFEVMLGMDPLWALIVTSGVLVIYVFMGGAHADILTDGVQGHHDADTGGGGDRVVVRVRRRRGREHAESVRQPGGPGRTPGWTPEHVDPSLPLLVVHRLHRAGAPAAGSVAAPRQQAVGFEGYGPAAILHQTGVRVRDHLGLCWGWAVYSPGRCSGTRWTTRTRPCRCSFIELFPSWLAALIGVGILAAIMSTGRRARGVLVPGDRQRPVPPNTRAVDRAERHQRGTRSPGTRHQPVGDGGGDGHLYGDGVVPPRRQRRLDRLDRHRRNDGGLCGTVGSRCAVAWVSRGPVPMRV